MPRIEEMGGQTRYSIKLWSWDVPDQYSVSLKACLIVDDFLKKHSVEKSKPMNIVIKIRSAGGQPCVKISDDLSKNTGLEDQVRRVKEQLGLLPRDRKSIDHGEKFPGKAK